MRNPLIQSAFALVSLVCNARNQTFDLERWNSFVGASDWRLACEIYDHHGHIARTRRDIVAAPRGFYSRVRSVDENPAHAQPKEAGALVARYWYRAGTNIHVWDNNALSWNKRTNSVYKHIYEEHLGDLGMVCSLGLPWASAGFVHAQGTNLEWLSDERHALFGQIVVRSNQVVGIRVFADAKHSNNIGGVRYEFDNQENRATHLPIVYVSVRGGRDVVAIEKEIRYESLSLAAGEPTGNEFGFERCLQQTPMTIHRSSMTGSQITAYNPHTLLRLAGSDRRRRVVRRTYFVASGILTAAIVAVAWARGRPRQV